MRITSLKSMPYAKAHIIYYDNGAIDLMSYTTVVAEISPDRWLRINGLYSPTTRRHISCFMRENTPFTYQAAKACYWGDYELNLDTGEVRAYN